MSVINSEKSSNDLETMVYLRSLKGLAGCFAVWQYCLKALAFITLVACSQTALAQSVQFLPVITTVAGNGTAGYTGDSGNALNATVGAGGHAATADAFGNIYIADTANNVIRRVDAVTGIITTVAGGGTVCAAAVDTLGNGCPATQATLNGPRGVHFFKGDMYIVDGLNLEIRVVSAATGIISDYAGNPTKTGAPKAGTLATATSFSNVRECIFDASGNMFVVTSAVVVRIDAVTKLVAAVAGSGTSNPGNGGPANSAVLANLVGVAVDASGNVYIVGPTDSTVRKITIPAGATTGIITNYAGSSGVESFAGDGMTANNALFNAPTHVSVDAVGNVYVADSKNNRIRMIAPPAAGQSYGVITTIVGTGTAGFSGDGDPALSATLSLPQGVDFTPAGDLLILDATNNRVRVVYPTGSFPAVGVGSTATQTVYANVTSLTPASFSVSAGYPDFMAGSPTSGCTAGIAVTTTTTCAVTATFQPTLAGQRIAPIVLTDSNGNNYSEALTGIGIAPAATLLPGKTSTVGGGGATVCAGSLDTQGNGCAATSAQLHTPTAVAIDGHGNYFVADSANNEVREITAAGVISRVAGTGTSGASGDGSAATSATLNGPMGVAVDGAGDLYIADTGNNRIRFVNVATGVISTFAGTGTAGYTGDGGLATGAKLTSPQGLALTASGVLYIADTGNSVVRAIGLRSNAIFTLAGTGTPGFAGDGGPSAAAQLTTPTGVTVDGNGVIYIADTGNQRIREIANGLISTLAGTGTSGFNGDGTATGAQLNGPTGLTVDAAADLYVADTGNDRIRRITAGQITTVAGTGAVGYTGDGGNSALATLNAPQGIALDGTGNILIAEAANNVLREINTSTSTLTFATINPTTTSATQTVTLSNAGNLPLVPTNVAPFPVGFTQKPSGALDCSGSGVSLVPGSACNFVIAFTPPSTGNYSGNIVTTDNSANIATSTQSIAVSGMGANIFVDSFTLPVQVVAGAAMPVTVSVTNPVLPGAVYTGKLHFTSSDPAAVLPADYAYTSTDNGSHVFSIQLFSAGTQTVTATDTSAPVTTATSSTTVVGGPAKSITIISGNLQTANINTAFASTLTVMAKDAYGNPSAGSSVTFTTPSTGVGATFAGSATYTAVTGSTGVVTSPSLTANGLTGAFSVQVSAPTVVTPATFTLTNTSSVAPTFTLTSNPSSLFSLPPGTSGVVTVTAASIGGFNSPINLVCTSPASTLTCQLSVMTLAPSGNGSSTSFNVTVQTAGPSHAALGNERSSTMYAGLLLLTLGLSFRKKKYGGITLVLLLAMALFGTAGCGRGTSSTVSGVYPVVVTGTSGSLTASTTITCYVGGGY